MHAVTVLGADDTPSPLHAVEVTENPVGRDDELRLLVEAIASGRNGGESVIDVVGPAGIGKSQLVAAALEQLQCADPGCPILRIDATTYAQGSPFLALRSPLRSLVTSDVTDEQGAAVALERALIEADASLRPWLPVIGEAWRVVIPETPEVARLDPKFRAATLLRHATTALTHLIPASTVVVVEDAHWLDTASAELLEFLKLRRGLGWVVLSTRRSGANDGPSPIGVRRLDIGPLEPAAARALVRRTAAHLGPGQVTAIIDRADGNPLFLVELARAAGSGLAVDELPHSVEALFVAQIDAMSALPRTTLRRASVLGSRAPEPLVRALLRSQPGGGQVGATLASLAGYLDAADGYVRFRHDLLRQAAYDGLPYRTRRSLHCAAADLIVSKAVRVGSEERVDLLSTHTHLSGRFEESWHWSRTAATNARARGASTEALLLLERAYDASRRLPKTPPADVRRVLLDLAECADLAGRVDRAVWALGKASALTQSDVEAADVMRLRGRIHQRHDSVDRGRRWYARALRRIDGQTTDDADLLRASLWALDGSALLERGRLAAAIPVLERALETADRLGDDECAARALTSLIWALMDTGDPRVDGVVDRALDCARRSGHGALLGAALNSAGTVMHGVDWDAAVDYWTQARGVRESVGDLLGVAVTGHNVALILSDRGQLADAEALLLECLETWEPARFLVGVAMATINLGAVRMRLNDPDGARARFDSARSTLTGTGLDAAILELDLREVECECLYDDPDAAAARVQRIRTRLKDDTDQYLVAILAYIAGMAHARGGRTDDARRELGSAIALARNLDSRLTLALSLAVLGALGGVDAPALLEESSRLLAALGVTKTGHLLDPAGTNWMELLAAQHAT